MALETLLSIERPLNHQKTDGIMCKMALFQMYFLVSFFQIFICQRGDALHSYFKDIVKYLLPLFLMNFLLVKDEQSKELMSCFTHSPTEGWQIHKPSKKIA